MKYLLLVLLIAYGAIAETITVSPLADTYTVPTGGCFGFENEIRCANKSSAGYPDERMQLLFDLSEYSGENVISAKLNLEVFYQCGSGSGTVTQYFAATEEWDENWNGTHVSIEATPYGSYHFLGYGWSQVDVTTLVQGWLNGEISNYGIVFKVNGTYPFTKCYSRETTHSPFLEITLSENAFEANTWAGIKRTWINR